MTEKCVLVIELPIENFVVSNSHGLSVKVTVLGRDRYDSRQYVEKEFDASAFTKQAKIESVP